MVVIRYNPVSCFCLLNQMLIHRGFQDVDLLVMTNSISQEQLKRTLVLSDLNFYLIEPKTPGATYKVLWFRLAGYRRSCKVDILIPGVMNIPPVPSDRITIINDLPSMPFSGIFFLKLQGWLDHRNSDKHWMQQKQHADARDILSLLKIAVRQGRRPAHDKWLPESFVEDGKQRAKLFATVYGGMEDWVKIEVL
jgi:hypothetical protein